MVEPRAGSVMVRQDTSWDAVPDAGSNQIADRARAGPYNPYMNYDSMNAALLEDLVRLRGVVMMVGAPDTGKTTLARLLLEAAVMAGRTVAYVDADIGQSTTGPPTCVGMKLIRSQGDLHDLHTADELRFVGAINPDGVVLQQVVATAALVEAARSQAELVVLDTTGAISASSDKR